MAKSKTRKNRRNIIWGGDKKNRRSFATSYARALIRRVEQRLRKSAQNRRRPEYADGYRIAANLLRSA